MSLHTVDKSPILKNETENKKFGDVILLPDCDSVRLVTLPDRDGKPIILPMINRPDISPATNQVPTDLQELGIENLSFLSLSEESHQYLLHALKKGLPLLLAVHATFNMDVRPNLSLFPDVDKNYTPPFLTAFTGPPHIGKTALIIASSLPCVDLDPFTRTSVSRIVPIVKLAFPPYGVITKASQVSKLIEIIENESRLPPLSEEEISKIYLKKALTDLLAIYSGKTMVGAIFVDLPGTDLKKETPRHCFQLLQHAISCIDLTEVTASYNISQKKERTNYSEMFGPDFMPAYLLAQRQIVFGRRDRDNPNLLFNKAKTADEQLRKEVIEKLSRLAQR